MSQRTVRVHVPILPPEKTVGSLSNILLAGLRSHPAVMMSADPAQADYIMLDSRHLDSKRVSAGQEHKTIIVDFRDDQRAIFDDPCLVYFKRSIVKADRSGFIEPPRDLRPISYCLRESFLHSQRARPERRDIDIAVLFDPENSSPERAIGYRQQVARAIAAEFYHRDISVGLAGQAGSAGRNTFQAAYFDVLARAKIVVTCNPDRWEGDYRLFEALSAGALVISDSMMTPVVHPFIDRQHLVYYDREDMPGLVALCHYYLSRADEREAIALAGCQHARLFHKPVDRITEILATAASIQAH